MVDAERFALLLITGLRPIEIVKYDVCDSQSANDYAMRFAERFALLLITGLRLIEIVKYDVCDSQSASHSCSSQAYAL